MENTQILEPIHLYKTKFKNQINDESNKYFEELVKISKVNKEENKALVKKYNISKTKADKAQKKFNSLNSWYIFLYILAGLALTAGLICLFFGLFLEEVNVIVLTSVGASLIVASIILFIVNFKVLRQKVKLSEQTFNQLTKIKNKNYQDCYNQIHPLLMCFDWNIPSKIIEKVTPLIDLDPIFDVRKFNYMYDKYGFKNLDEKSKSTCCVVSGSIVGNPFLVVTNNKTKMGTKVYRGSITISWVETVHDSQGNSRTVTKTQVLTASVQKPCPYYGQETYLVYGNEAAPNLIFTRKPSNYDGDDEKDLEKFVENKEKKLEKLSRKAIKKGKKFTLMANTEFESLFGAVDRNNEVEYRLLFTPLAQTNYVELLTSKEPYGDDFYFNKYGPLNIISSKHSQITNYTANPSLFQSHDLEALKKIFVDYMNNFFQSLYFDLAPLLSIPLYQQHKPIEYIYNKDFLSNYTNYEAETLANSFDPKLFAHPESVTRVMLKTHFLSKVGSIDNIEVKAYSYKTVQRVEYVSQMGGDGRMHSIPVYYDEYIPLERTSLMALKDVKSSNWTYLTFNDLIQKQMNRLPTNMSYQRGLFAWLIDNEVTLEDDKNINSLFNNINHKN